MTAALAPCPAFGATSMDLLFPAGYGLSQVTVGASENVILGPGVTIQTLDGSAGIVTNAGDGRFDVGPRSTAGTLASTGSMKLGPKVVANTVRSSKTVALSPGDRIGDLQEGVVLTPLVHRTLTVPSLDGPPSNVSIEPGGSATLSPGRYATVSVGSHATVTMSAGVYLADNFVLGPRSKLHLDSSAGTVYLYVSRAVSWKGQLTGDARRFCSAFSARGRWLSRTASRGRRSLRSERWS